MKRFLMLVLALSMVFLIVACGKRAPVNKHSDSAKTGQEDTERNGEQAQPKAPGEVKGGKGALCKNWRAFNEARERFDKYVLGQSENHEIVSVKLPYATIQALEILEYTLPLEFMGDSIVSLGKFDADMEIAALEMVWANDVEYIYNQDAEYLLKGTNTTGNKLEIKAVFDEDTDSLRLEGRKDGAPYLVMEYAAIDGGYAAQYYLETVTGFDTTTPITKLCTYKLVFRGNNGSEARYDGVASEPESIFRNAPDAESFIDSTATHWFTINNGQFTGSLGGIEF